MKKYYCKDCGIKISDSRHERCIKCFGIIRRGYKRPDLIIYNKSRNQKGVNNGNFRNWSSKKRNKCIICDEILGNCSVYLNINKCRSCMMKERWTDLSYKVKVITKTMKSCKIEPNNKERYLIDLLPKSFKYVGNGKIWIQNFNPDFIDKKQKSIIEVFGDYWHRNTQERDKRRLKTYKKYGYKTLIIWEHELKNIDKLRMKLERFI